MSEQPAPAPRATLVETEALAIRYGRTHRARGREPRRAGGLRLRAPRPQRLGQVLAPPRAARRAAAVGRPGSPPRRGPVDAPRRADGAGRRRPGGAERAARDDRPPALRVLCTAPPDLGRGPRARAPLALRRAGRSAVRPALEGPEGGGHAVARARAPPAAAAPRRPDAGPRRRRARRRLPRGDRRARRPRDDGLRHHARPARDRGDRRPRRDPARGPTRSRRRPRGTEGRARASASSSCSPRSPARAPATLAWRRCAR